MSMSMHRFPVSSARLLVPGYKDFQNPELIVRLEGIGNYTLLHLGKLTRPLIINRGRPPLLSNDQPLMVSKTLKYFERQLPGFIRVSKSTLINPSYISQVLKVNNRIMYVLLLDGTRIEVSRRRIDDTLEKLRIYENVAGVRTGG